MSERKYHFSGSKTSTSLDQPLHLTKFVTTWLIPEALVAKYGNRIEVIDEHILDISGLDMDKMPGTVEQKYMGTSREFIGTIVDTKQEWNISFEANVDPQTGEIYPYALFRDWAKLCYDAETGIQAIKADYVGSVVVEVHDLKGKVLRKTTAPIAFPTSTPDEWGLKRTSDDIYKFKMKIKVENGNNAFAR